MQGNYNYKWGKEDGTEKKQGSRSILVLIIDEAEAFSDLSLGMVQICNFSPDLFFGLEALLFNHLLFVST